MEEKILRIVALGGIIFALIAGISTFLIIVLKVIAENI